MTLEQRKTPGRGTGGISKNHHSHHDGAASSIAHDSDHGEVFAQMLNGIYIVIAEIKSPGPEPRYRCRFYVQLASAQLAVDRARMNGKDAYLFIGQVTIVGGDPR